MGLKSKNWLFMAKGRLVMLVLACLLGGCSGMDQPKPLSRF
jgi:hypothetical protein